MKASANSQELVRMSNTCSIAPSDAPKQLGIGYFKKLRIGAWSAVGLLGFMFFHFRQDFVPNNQIHKVGNFAAVTAFKPIPGSIEVLKPRLDARSSH